MTPLEERYRAIAERIAVSAREAGRPAPVLIAVSKTQPASMIEELYQLGHRDFGENYVQELAAKSELLRERGLRDLRWHFLGHLQTNKAKALVEHATVIHSVDSLKLAQEIDRRWNARRIPERLPILLSVNIDLEASKTGFIPDEVPGLAPSIAALESLDLRGLMCIPSPGSTDAFSRLRELEERCRPHTRGELSMGMTQDFESAILAGSTHVRIGTAIFGERQKALL